MKSRMGGGSLYTMALYESEVKMAGGISTMLEAGGLGADVLNKIHLDLSGLYL